jgi:hypothetical protein
MSSWLIAALIFLSLLGGCSVMAGDFDHWPASLLAVAVLVAVKVANDRVNVLSWPMEFFLVAGVTMILFNLVRLYFVPLPY